MLKSSAYQKRSSLKYHRSVQINTSPQSNARHPARSRQARRRHVQPPGWNTRFCLDFVSKAFIFQKLLYVTYGWVDAVVLKVICSAGDGKGRIVLITVEAVLAESKSLTAGGVRISKGKKRGFGTSAPLSTRASSMQERAGVSIESSPNQIWPGTWGRDRLGQKSSYYHALLDLPQRPPYACESWYLVLHLPPW